MWPTGPDGCPLLGSGPPPAGRGLECAIFAGASEQFHAGANSAAGSAPVSTAPYRAATPAAGVLSCSWLRVEWVRLRQDSSRRTAPCRGERRSTLICNSLMRRRFLPQASSAHRGYSPTAPNAFAVSNCLGTFQGARSLPSPGKICVWSRPFLRWSAFPMTWSAAPWGALPRRTHSTRSR